MYETRRWITRDEIAQIHESIANNLFAQARQDPAKDNDKTLDHAADHLASAETLRYTGKLGNFQGRLW